MYTSSIQGCKTKSKVCTKAQVKGKGKGDKKKPGKAAIVISSDSEESLGKVDFPHLPQTNLQIFQLRSQKNQINP